MSEHKKEDKKEKDKRSSSKDDKDKDKDKEVRKAMTSPPIPRIVSPDILESVKK